MRRMLLKAINDLPKQKHCRFTCFFEFPFGIPYLSYVWYNPWKLRYPPDTQNMYVYQAVTVSMFHITYILLLWGELPRLKLKGFYGEKQCETYIKEENISHCLLKPHSQNLAPSSRMCYLMQHVYGWLNLQLYRKLDHGRGVCDII